VSHTPLLSRIAGTCYWMARYLERSDHIARTVTQAYWLSLRADERDAPVLPLERIASIHAERSLIEALPAPREPGALLALLLVERANPGSLWCCVRAVRENARVARPMLTNVLWESINTIWIEARGLDPDALATRGIEDVLTWTRQRCQWIRGAIDEFLPPAVSRMIRIGTRLERIDNLVRLLGLVIPEPVHRPCLGERLERTWLAVVESAGLGDWVRRQVGCERSLPGLVQLLVRDREQPRALANLSAALLDDLEDLRQPAVASVVDAAELLTECVRGVDLRAMDAVPGALDRMLRLVAQCHQGLQTGLFSPAPSDPLPIPDRASLAPPAAPPPSPAVAVLPTGGQEQRQGQTRDH
jgi:uncharacterized alpha-E superfamily protein